MTTSTLYDQAKLQLNLTDDLDHDLLERLIDVAQNWLESQLGYTLASKYPPSSSPWLSTVPPALDHAILLMAAHFYVNREATLVGVNAAVLPLGVSEIVQDYRLWSWGEADA